MDSSLQADRSQLPAEAAGFAADVEASQNYIYGKIKPPYTFGFQYLKMS